MAHWFHRNPLKATSIVSFDVRGAAKSSRTQKLCGQVFMRIYDCYDANVTRDYESPL